MRWDSNEDSSLEDELDEATDPDHEARVWRQDMLREIGLIVREVDPTWETPLAELRPILNLIRNESNARVVGDVLNGFFLTYLSPHKGNEGKTARRGTGRRAGKTGTSRRTPRPRTKKKAHRREAYSLNKTSLRAMSNLGSTDCLRRGGGTRGRQFPVLHIGFSLRES